MKTLPPKPKYTEPCNHCGQCCTLSLCSVAEQAFPGDVAPCRALVVDGSAAMCGLVAMEKLSGLDGVVSRILGIGCGCSMPDLSTTELEVIVFDRLSYAKVYRPAPSIRHLLQSSTAIEEGR
jgi:hypothetical protein